GGNWNGAGISSTAARNDTAALHGLGYADASALGGSSFMGESVDTTSLLVRYTEYGDNNLDGNVEVGNDFDLFGDGMSGHGSTWMQGDYNYDGKIDLGNDFNLFLKDFLNIQPKSLGDLDAVGQPAVVAKAPATILAASAAVLPAKTSELALSN